MAYTPSPAIFKTNPGYTPPNIGGFNNLGPTPGVINQPAQPQTWAQKQTALRAIGASNVKSGLLGGANPTVKSRTEVGPDNTKITETYHPPTPEEISKANANLSKEGKTPEQLASENTTGAVAGSTEPTKPDYTIYPGMIAGATSAAQGNIPLGQKAQDIATQTGQQISDIGQRGAAARGGYLSTGTSPVAEGNAAILAQTTAAQQQAAAAGGEMALKGTAQGITAQQQVQAGMIGAAGLTPEALRYGGVAGGLSPQTQAEKYTQDVLSGKRSYADAVSGMGLYGNAGKQFLDASIRAKQPDFNFAQAASLAPQQGTIAVNYKLADTALSNVEDKLKELATLQKTNIPAINSVANWVSTTFGAGSEQTRAMTGAVQSLRNAYGSLLASVRGGTPTDYVSQATAEIPNEPTPNDIKAIRDNFEKLGKARTEILGRPGEVSAPSGSSGYKGGGAF